MKITDVKKISERDYFFKVKRWFRKEQEYYVLLTSLTPSCRISVYTEDGESLDDRYHLANNPICYPMCYIRRLYQAFKEYFVTQKEKEQAAYMKAQIDALKAGLGKENEIS